MKKRFLESLFIILFFLPFVLQAATPLPSTQAFQLRATANNPHKVLLHWQVAPGYYLYANKFKFETKPFAKVIVSMPQGEFKYDTEKGREEVLTGNFIIPLSFEQKEPSSLVINYQGCSQEGFCYPPIQQKFAVDFESSTVTEVKKIDKNQWFDTIFDQEKIKKILKTQHFGIVLLIFFIFGLFLAFTPCVLPMLPILSSIIMGDAGKNRSGRAFGLSFFYVVGAATAYALIGLLAASIGQSMQVLLQKPIFILSVSIIFVLLAVINFGWSEMIFPRRWQKAIHALNHRIDGGSYLSVFFMGIVSTLVVSPCVTAPLMGVLLYIADTGDKVLGASALFTMGIGLGTPLIIGGTSFNYLLPKSGPWLLAMKHFFGFLMMLMALWLMSRVMPLYLSYGLSVLLLLIFACYTAFCLPRYLKRPRFCLMLGTLIGIVGFYTMAQLAPSWLNVKEPLNSYSLFMRVNSLAELETTLAKAKKDKIPVFLDFYADWCTCCLVMEKEVLNSPKVISLLKEFRLLRVDLTQNTADDQAIMKRFDVIAPPSFLLFDRSGIELTENRIVGEVDIPFFLSRLQAAI